MLNTLKDLWDALTGPVAEDSPQAQAHALQLATAVLLVEVMRSDATLQASEREAVLAALTQRFSLTPDELARLLELAQHTAKDAYDYHRFTNRINDHFSHPQKVAMVESLWRVAYADGHLDAHEQHAISKIAGLLHVTHGEYIAAKLHAQHPAAS